MCQPGLAVWSNERTLSHYKDLAFYILNQFMRTYGVPRSEIKDFEQHMMLAISGAPDSYRPNSGGMYTILKNAAWRWIGNRSKHIDRHDRRFVRMDHIGGGSRRHTHRSFEDGWDQLLLDDGCIEKIERNADAQKLARAVELLAGPERVCIGLYYGIGYARSYPVSAICRKLAAPRSWVERHIARGEKMLKAWVSGTSLQAEEPDARASSSSTARSAVADSSAEQRTAVYASESIGTIRRRTSNNGA